ncbi:MULTISPECIES: DUF742 domain-containing protein [Thermomonosporaceae]|uniref:DUF742 domain-containing protein n=1 Tax=Thermomonosporaceae TaxID=2012 RepID=UPI00255AB235|nr:MULTISPECIES: DUF742 domain-containing protein [Thermomonosporaceae]MDL4774194.1 DUF742 domain-containing protein [Actinomadura xylanilytica]
MTTAGERHGSGASPVRPYVLTGGRAATRHGLTVDTLLRATPDGPPLRADAAPQTRALLRLHRGGILTIAESAAYLGLPVSVVMVLAEDLITSDHLHQHAASQFAEINPTLLQEVLDGLERV